MKETVWLLFVIPTLGIVVIVLNQFWDEMFKKKFVIDRRGASAGQRSNRRSSGDTGVRNRRYSDRVGTAADRVGTAADRVGTAADRVGTAADRVAPSDQPETVPESAPVMAAVERPAFEHSSVR
jgi:hypothetical protein